MLEADRRQAAVAGPADAGDVESLVDGALDAGPEGAFVLPGVGFLLGAGSGEVLVAFLGTQDEHAAPIPRGGALPLEGAFPAGQDTEGDDDGVGAVLFHRVPVGARRGGWAHYGGQGATCRESGDLSTGRCPRRSRFASYVLIVGLNPRDLGGSRTLGRSSFAMA